MFWFLNSDEILRVSSGLSERGAVGWASLRIASFFSCQSESSASSLGVPFVVSNPTSSPVLSTERGGRLKLGG